MAYTVVVKRSAEKDLADIAEPFRRRIRDAIAELAEEPRPVGVLKLKGAEEGYRIAVARDYRVRFTVNDEARTVYVYAIANRREAYR